ncbi:MAG: hypothetical protein JWL80_170, partial [Parcubacteria group bacterium]|nr:hypothetical protein [Parcubacteria group bacterium]
NNRLPLANALTGTIVEADGKLSYAAGSGETLLSLAIVICFLVFSLIIAKSISNRTGNGIGKLTSAATGAAGGLLFGTALGGMGRKFIGKPGEIIANNATLQEAARTKVGLPGAGARLALYAARKARSGTFDVRNASVPTAAVGDAIEGTLGRTAVGRFVGADDVNWKSVPIGGPAAGVAGVGKGGTTGYKENKEADEKRIAAKKKADNEELRRAEDAAAIRNGIKPGATQAQIDAMEKSINRMSDKEIEAIVDGNRALLDTQAFANNISVQQLEAINKSDKFSEGEKDMLKGKRFGSINTEMDRMEAIRTAGGTPVMDPGVAKAIKGLSDPELAMVKSDHLNREDFVSQLKPSQVDAIMKNNKFTKNQKKNIGDRRKAPLIRALDTSANGHLANPTLVRDMINKRLSAKDIAGLMSTTGDFVDTNGLPLVGASILLHPDVLSALKPNILKKMALEMEPADITTLRAALEAPSAHAIVNPSVLTYLASPAGIADFS